MLLRVRDRGLGLHGCGAEIDKGISTGADERMWRAEEESREVRLRCREDDDEKKEKGELGSGEGADVGAYVPLRESELISEE